MASLFLAPKVDAIVVLVETVAALALTKLAVTVAVSTVVPVVNVTEASPLAFVTADATDRLPVPVVSKETVTPCTALLLPSRTRKTVAVAAFPAVTPVWLPPDCTAIWVGALAVPLAVKVTGDPPRPATVAVSVLAPALAPSVQLVRVATPFVSLATVPGLRLPPPAVTANVTVVPLTGLPYTSVTRTEGGAATGALVVPL